MGFLRKNHLLIGYLIFLLLIALAFVQTSRLRIQMEERNIARAVIVCEATNDQKRVMVTMLRQFFIIDAPEFEVLNEGELERREERINRLEDTILSPIDCTNVVQG